jgi:hypothetical protein
MPQREKTGARKKAALHQRRESTPALRLPQVQQECGHRDRGRLRGRRRYRGCCLYLDRGRHTLEKRHSGPSLIFFRLFNQPFFA